MQNTVLSDMQHASETIDQIDDSIYQRLRCRAAVILRKERPGSREEAAELVHEAFLRIKSSGAPVRFHDRHHLLATATLVMRRVVIDRARRPDFPARIEWAPLLEDCIPPAGPLVDDLGIRELLLGLAAFDRRKCAVVQMRFYQGLDFREIGATLGVSDRTAKRDWKEAKKWLRNRIGQGGNRIKTRGLPQRSAFLDAA